MRRCDGVGVLGLYLRLVYLSLGSMCSRMFLLFIPVIGILIDPISTCNSTS